ncbi:MAG: sulfatase [Candidatus Hydrogenedentes bacterium]|nr:sulfatase [Candidatus Hydrogenedentota bacterium]
MRTKASRRDFLKLAAAGAVSAPVVAAVRPRSETTARMGRAARRNIVFILTDDQRYDHLGCMGHPFLQTPNLDALAAEGVLFENAFVTTALCSPSRACILTGQYAHRHGVVDNVSPFPPENVTFPELLQNQGYRTAFIGKWHMGGASDAPQPGFDRWVSFKGQGVYYDPQFNVDGQHTPRKGYVTDLLTDYAVKYIEQARRGDPFFLYLSHKAVHSNFQPAERHKGCYADQTYPQPASMANTEENYRGKPNWVRAQRDSWHGVDGMYNNAVSYDDCFRTYAETLRAVDDSVGRVVKTLKRKGLLESTLIVFTSDNGFLCGEHGLIDKRAMYEPSIRVPLIALCPELIKGGERRKEMILNIDFAPTFLELAGGDVPDTMQGRSFHDLLGSSVENWRGEFLYEYFWERSFPQTPTMLGVRTERHKLVKYHGIWDRAELYDVQADPAEQNNLLGDFLVKRESSGLDSLIRNSTNEEVKALYADLDGRLSRLMEQTGCAENPTWRTEAGANLISGS